MKTIYYSNIGRKNQISRLKIFLLLLLMLAALGVSAQSTGGTNSDRYVINRDGNEDYRGILGLRTNLGAMSSTAKAI